jgi:hypothetical protein
MTVVLEISGAWWFAVGAVAGSVSTAAFLYWVIFIRGSRS